MSRGVTSNIWTRRKDEEGHSNVCKKILLADLKTFLVWSVSHPSRANPMKLLRVKIKSKFYKFPKNESYEALFVDLLVGITLKYKLNASSRCFIGLAPGASLMKVL